MTLGLMASIWRNRKGSQCLDFVRLRIAVAGWPTLDHVRDVHLIAFQVDRFDDLRQQLTGSAHERFALPIFVRARRFSDEHQIGVWVAHAEDDLRATERVQLASLTGRADLVLEPRETVRGIQRGRAGSGGGRAARLALVAQGRWVGSGRYVPATPDRD